MKVLSVNVSQPRTVEWNGRMVTSGIFKEPVVGRVQVNSLSIVGDRQVDLRYHGGFNKAVYAYPIEHYTPWTEFLGSKFNPGQFGENLTVEGLLEETVFLGDLLKIGSTVLQVTQPRKPCFKLGMKMRMPEFPKWFLKSGRLGFYLRVVTEGELGAGDTIEKASEDDERISIRELFESAYGEIKNDPVRIEQILRRETLAREWTHPLREKLILQDFRG